MPENFSYAAILPASDRPGNSTDVGPPADSRPKPDTEGAYPLALAFINDGDGGHRAGSMDGDLPLSTGFEAAFKQECLEGSAIAPALFDAAVRFTEDSGRWEVHELLGWEIRPNWQIRKPHDFGTLAGFYQEAGELWQGKPEKMPQGMNGRYLARVGIGARAYMPPIPAPIRELLGIAPDGPAWDAIAADPSIPITLTEGGKKSLCSLSHGLAAIAGFGVDAFSRKGEDQLLPELRAFCHPERRWVIAFDEDTKRSTRRRVRRATARLGRYLVAAGVPPENISIAEWEPAQGKGLDDLVAQSGAAALHQAIAQATPFPAWKRGGWDAYLKGKYPELFSLTHAPAIALNQRYLPSLQLPQAGGLLAISSPMGTGKTEIMQGLIKQAKAIDGECLVELIGYRNSLGKQSAARLGIDHIHDLQGDRLGQTFIDSAQGLAYCLDSLHRRIERVLKAIASGRRVLVLLDEIDAVLKHLFLGRTLGNRRGEIMMMLCELLQAVSNGGGWIVCGEADLSSLPIAFLEAITGKAAQVVVNEWQGNPWQIEAPMPSNAKGEPSAALMGLAAISRIISELRQGRRVVAPTDSQAWGNLLERAAIAAGYRVIRLDGTTSEEPWAHQLMQAPDAYLAQECPELFIFTPTAESGLSITGSHFDVMAAYGSHLEHRAIMQLMGRIRADIPRVIYCREFSLSDESGQGSDPESILKDWQRNAEYSAMAAKLGDAAPSLDMDGIELLLHQFAAKYQARIHARQAQLRPSLLAAMEAQGYHVTQPQELPLDEGFKDELKAIREDMAIERAENYAAADSTGYLDSQGKRIEIDAHKARRILAGTGSTQAARVSAQKCITLEAYPGLPVDDADFVGRCITESRGRGLAAHTALFMAQHPEIAQSVDRLCWEAQASNQILWLPSVTREAPKATLIAQSGLLELFKLEEYSEASPEVQRVRGFAIAYQADIKRVLGLWCAENHTGIQIVNKLARRLGMKAVSRKIGPRGQQSKIWHWSDESDGDRAAIHSALRQKWADVLAEIAPVSSISDSKSPSTEIEDTAPVTHAPGDFVGWRGRRWELRAIADGIAQLIDPEDWIQIPESAPVGELEREEIAA